MVTKHFFKVLVVFVVMIILGIAGVFFVNYLDEKESENIPNNNQVAK